MVLMNESELQAKVLKKLLYKQKLCIQDKEFLKRLTFVLCGNNKQYYSEKLKELSGIFNISEMLIMSKRFHHALCYLCMADYVVREISGKMEKDFRTISKQI